MDSPPLAFTIFLLHLAADLEAAKKAAPVYANSRLNFRAPPSEAPDAKQQRVNSDITAPEVRLVNADGTHEVLPLAQALKAAQDASLDLVEVAGNILVAYSTSPTAYNHMPSSLPTSTDGRNDICTVEAWCSQ